MAQLPESAAALDKEVMELLQSHRYDPTILPRLEEFVNCQVTHNFCDPETNLAVLKLYQFHPETYNASTVSKILIKALMNLPTSDFLCSLYLIPERRQIDEPIPVISHLAQLLETGRFTDFWAASGSCAQLLASVPGSLDAVRDFMMDVVSRTYKSIDVPILAEILNLDEPGVVAAANARGWNLANGTVTCPSTEENQPRPPTLDEHLSFRQVASKML
ncbi:Translation initiation factor eIF3, subunit K [Chondrus crispus]|uniref:Eukaryotic translation initiation factor 3 subunit K n=1 Tax=Chondrus crispus TaxID=2769 RepID=R7QDP0_CHOCR|nr:Translation initiation factor eIF3, subunit K [Chondrus crispus]CDF35530.1 Translation initiation factor eIF3, subunit K [Chondrus crispus]|eukprot:XP_005715349.1 Translation initiation factor eIF3, subunit K [Chondrus crispus]